MAGPRISRNDDGILDGFYAQDATVHFEAVDESDWWIDVTTRDGRTWHIRCGAVNPKAKGYATVA